MVLMSVCCLLVNKLCVLLLLLAAAARECQNSEPFDVEVGTSSTARRFKS